MEKDKDIIEIIIDEPRKTYKADVAEDEIISDGQSETDDSHENIFVKAKNKAADYLDALPKDLSPMFIKVSCGAIAAVVILGAVLGAVVPKSENSRQNSLQRLRLSDSAYLDAKEESDEKRQQISSLNTRLKEREAQLDEFHLSQDNIDKITESNASLEEEKKSLESEISQKETTLVSLSGSINSLTEKTVTWSSGDYTVGKDITAGKYTVTGTGSIVIANSGKALVNTSLKSSGASYTLNTGDRVHIDGSAKLVPEQ